MSKLQWGRPQDRTYESGLDRGVLYPEFSDAVVWNGLVSVQDNGESETKEYYVDGTKYLAYMTGRDWAGSLEAVTFPDEFALCVGFTELGDGLLADSQLPRRFDLSYRTMVTAPDMDSTPHYKIHMIYGALASIGKVEYATLTDSIEPSSFEFDLTAVPQMVEGIRPTAHFVVDTRKIDAQTRQIIEDMLYGSDDQDPFMPALSTLVDLLSFGDEVTVVYNGNGTWTATGSNKNLQMINHKNFVIKNANATYITPEIYEFTGIDGDTPDEYPIPPGERLVLLVDTDGGYYHDLVDGPTNVGMDTDGTPYYAEGVDALSLDIDTDGVIYFRQN